MGVGQSARKVRTADGAQSRLQWRYASPEFWRAWVFIAWLRAVSILPLRWSIRIHRGLGLLLHAVAKKQRSRIAASVAHCFPERSSSEIDLLVREHFQHKFAILAELGAAWFGSVSRLEKLFEISGEENLQAAIRQGKGIILYSGHFTTLEIAVPYVRNLVPHFAFMYARRRNALLNHYQLRGRLRASHSSFPSDDVRSMIKALSKNAAIWYASDQHQDTSTETVQLFGMPFEMSTALPRIARTSGAAVVPMFFFRKNDDSGYTIRFDPLLENFPSEDRLADTQRLTTILEGFIKECPAQYIWKPRKSA